MTDRQLGQISSHVTWSSEAALSLISGITGAQRPLRSPLRNVTISVVILLFGFILFYVELQMVGKDSELLRWQPAISGSCIQTLQKKKKKTRSVSQRRD